jgi:hypothetical protein
MKKTLLFTALAFIVILGVNAQTTIWNLGGDPTVATNGSAAWALNTGLASGVLTGTVTSPGGVETINGLTITTGPVVTTSFCGIVSASPKNFTSPTTNISYSFANKFLLNGSGYSGALNTDAVPSVFIPIQKYASFKVSGNSTIYFIGATNTNGSDRILFITDGTQLIGSKKFTNTTVGTTTTADILDATINYTGPATTLYVYFNASIVLYYMSATNIVLTATSQVLSDKGVSFNGTEILNTKGLSLEVYNVLGKKVASSTTSVPTANFQKGVYIVRVSGTNDSLKICI